MSESLLELDCLGWCLRTARLHGRQFLMVSGGRITRSLVPLISPGWRLMHVVILLT